MKKLTTTLTIAALAAFAFTLSSTQAADKEHEHSHEAHADHMLEGYLAVSAALYKDDLKAAKKAATGMVKHDKDSAMAKPAQAIADSKDIETARTHFKMLSDVAIPVAKTEKTMHQMHCPMAMDGEGADWLQKSADEVQNPYLGTQMPHCGKVVK